jgi:hypothetical protein
MEKWEYTSLTIQNPRLFSFVSDEEHLIQFINTLNEWGEQGWQLVQVVTGAQGYVAIFKRRKLQDNATPTAS